MERSSSNGVMLGSIHREYTLVRSLLKKKGKLYESDGLFKKKKLKVPAVAQWVTAAAWVAVEVQI